MPSYRAPGVYVEEISSGSHPITPVGTSTAAFIGVTRKGPVNRASLITNFTEFERMFGGPYPTQKQHYLYYAVRHFFEQGGSRCYVVRIAHFDSLVQATAACQFDGTLGIDAVSPALRVSAITPGEWGRELTARVSSSSKFSVRLADDIPNASVAQIKLELNDHVQPGSLLWVARTVTGLVEKVIPDASDPSIGSVRLHSELPLKTGDVLFDGEIAPRMTVFGPEFSYEGRTNIESHVRFASGAIVSDNNEIGLISLNKADGTKLRPGDALTFVLEGALVVVDRVSVQQVTVGSNTKVVSVAEFAAQKLPAVPKNSRIYARDFTIAVVRGQEILEVHENLSLVNTNRTDHVNIRLGVDGGASQFIIASDESGAKDLTVVTPASHSLDGGNDGSANNSDFVSGLEALTPVRDAAILAVPNASRVVTEAALLYCKGRGDLFLILERPSTSNDVDAYSKDLNSEYAAIYDPWIEITDVTTGRPALVPSSGAVAGIYALTDSRRGVQKAPAGLDTGKVVVATGIERMLTKGEYDGLYQKRINGILKLRDGIHVWGSRTLSPDTEWSQVSIRRLFIFLKKSIENGTQWVTFEPNDPTLWKSIERNVGAFLRIQWLEGKLVGKTEKEAFFVRCNAETNPPEVVNAGQVVTVIGVAPSRPAEFVIFRIKQKVGQATG